MHDHLSTIAPIFDGNWIYKVGYTPAQQFNRFPMSAEPALLEELGINYLVSDHDLAPPDNHDFTLDRTFGGLRVYRFNRFRPMPFTVLGPGRAGPSCCGSSLRRFAFASAIRQERRAASSWTWRPTRAGGPLSMARRSPSRP